MSDAGSEPAAAVGETEAAVLPVLETQLRDAVESDAAVAADLQVWDPAVAAAAEVDAIHRAAARQANVLTNHVRYRVAVGREPPEPLRSTPVTPFRGLPTPPDVDAALDDLASTLAFRGDPGHCRDDVDDGQIGRDDADDGQMDPDDHLIGGRYAAVLSDDERRARGQFYTPSNVAELVVRWALEGLGERPRVLDPAAGTGTFPLSTYDALLEGHPDADPETILSKLVAVDVDEVALHLAALRLSARTGGGPVESFDRREGSFFDLEPGPDGDIPPVDAVVGNPPFVRAGDLSPGRDHFREHLRALGPGGGTPYADGERALSRRSDASVYFVTHATRFLRPGGRLGMVLPAKWLESDYGVGFRRFLADHYRVHAVVGFGARAFDALVDTVLLLAERRDRPPSNHDGSAVRSGRDDEPVRFVRLDGRVDATASLRLVRDGDPTDGGEGPADRNEAPPHDGTVTQTGPARVVRRGQATFAGARQCSPYLRAPGPLLALLDHPSLVPLGSLASVSRGVTTGANRFFLLDDDDRDRWEIDPGFLRPALRSIRGVDDRSLAVDDVEQSILDVHDFLAERLGEGARTDDPAGRAKDELRDAGHDALVEYVRHAESEGWHAGRTCQARRVWFDLGELPNPDAFVPKLVRERVFTVRNRAGAVPSNAIDCLSVHEGVDDDLLLGVLDSSLVRALMEVWGRDEAGLLQLMTYETRTLPVPDVRTFSGSEAAAVRDAAAALDHVGGDAGKGSDAQGELDEAVVEALGLDVTAGRIRTLRERLLRRRVEDGDRVEVPVS